MIGEARYGDDRDIGGARRQRQPGSADSASALTAGRSWIRTERRLYVNARTRRGGGNGAEKSWVWWEWEGEGQYGSAAWAGRGTRAAGGGWREVRPQCLSLGGSFGSPTNPP